MKFSLRSIFWLVAVAGFGCWLFSFPPAGVSQVETATKQIPSAFEILDLLAVVAADRVVRLLICVLVFLLPRILFSLWNECKYRLLPSAERKLQ
jgi:hypothetical protein